MLRERSAGAVVFRSKGGKREYLVLLYPSGHWDFPKGNLERGEAPEQTAAREVREETGLTKIRFINGFKEKITYYYKRGGSVVRKEVVYFLVEALSSDVKISWEHLGYKWLEYEEAVKRVTYETSRRVLEKAEDYLKKFRPQPTLDYFS